MVNTSTLGVEPYEFNSHFPDIYIINKIILISEGKDLNLNSRVMNTCRDLSLHYYI